MKKHSRLLSLSLVVLTSIAASLAGCSSDDDSPSPGGAGGAGGRGGSPGSGGNGGTPGTGGSGTGGSPGSGGAPAGSGGSGGATLDSGTGSGGASGDAGGDANKDGGSSDGAGTDGQAAVGERISLVPEIASRWMGARRSTKVEDGVMVFTGVFEANKFGGPQGHNLRIPIPGAKETVLEYRIRFDAGYDFSRGGKIPGLAGGSAPTGCVSTNGSGFSARMMWRENGKLIGYLYDNNQSQECGTGIDAGFNFKVGQWYTMKERVRLNNGRGSDGILEIWVDDRKVITRSNISYMNDGKVDQLLFHSFYGGSTQDWAPSRNSSISFAEIYVTLVEK
jgi:hypothetical protein